MDVDFDALVTQARERRGRGVAGRAIACADEQAA